MIVLTWSQEALPRIDPFEGDCFGGVKGDRALSVESERQEKAVVEVAHWRVREKPDHVPSVLFFLFCPFYGGVLAPTNYILN